MENARRHSVPQDAAREPRAAPPAICASALFGRSRAIVIEHEGKRYVLRITRNDKVMLTK